MPLILNGTTGVSGIDGSAGTPSYQGGDTNTGIFYPAADTIAFAEGGAEIARFDSSGNFGIGITPAANTRITLRTATTTDAAIVADNTSNSGFKVQFASNLTTILNDFNNPLALGTNNTERMRIDSSGNVRIGNTTGNGKLSVQDSSAALQEIFTNSGTNYAALEVRNTGSSIYIGKDNSAGTFFGSGTAYASCIWSGGAYPLVFFTTGTERMRITSGGLVGIGTSSPWSSISLNTPAAATDGYLGIKDPTYGGDIRFGKGSGINNDAIAGVWSNNNFLFYTDSTERMRITNGGTICMGTTNTDPSGNGVNGLAYVGSASALTANRSGNACFFLGRSTSTGSITIFRYNTADVGNIATNGSNCTYNSTSDYRLKENITPISNALSRVAQLKPVTYTWKKDGSAGEGFIAHELAEVCPEAVTGEKDAVDEEGKPVYQAIDQSVLVATLTAAIQEQQAMIEELKAKVAALETK